MKPKALLDIVQLIQTLLETNQKNGKLSKKSLQHLEKAFEALHKVLLRDGNLKIKDPRTYREVVRVIAEVSQIFVSQYFLNESRKNDQGSP